MTNDRLAATFHGASLTDTEALVGRNVMVGNRLATITDYNKFNRPPFAFQYPDGAREYGWRETFYVLPTAEEIAMKLSLVRFSDEQSDRMIELTMREAWPLADAVVDLLGGATNG